MERKDEMKKSNLPKILLAIGSVIAVIALCVLSSRFSWFGTAVSVASSADDSSSYDAAVTTENISTPSTESKESINNSDSVPVQSENSATDSATESTLQSSTSAATTTSKTEANSTASQTTTFTTTAATPQSSITAQTTTPAPLWKETAVNQQMYITVDCYSRTQAVLGATKADYMFRSTLVTVTAKTDTGYYKLNNGNFVHGDYLSLTKPAETTTTTTPKPQSTPTVDVPSDTDIYLSSEAVDCLPIEAEVFRLVNAERAKYGIAPLKWDSNAYKAANARLQEIPDKFSHIRPNGTKYYTIYGYGGTDIPDVFSKVGENIASGYSTAEKVVTAWMNSTKGHRENILNPEYENMAIAFGNVNDIYKYYWAQEFTTYR